MSKKEKVVLNFKENYLAMIGNSVGTRMFRNLFARVGKKKQDIVQDGFLSCAYFVSSILVIFGLIKEAHATVEGTIKDMEKSGWKRVEKPKKGSVLVWEAKEIRASLNKHIGFFVGRDRAISNNSEEGVPLIHHWTFKGQRKVEAIFWHKKLDQR
jgi:predicted nucleic acid-binding Zn finger protein